MSENTAKPKISHTKKSAQTKQQIIDAAMKLFSEKGYYKTNSKEIAKEAKVSIGCFYNYFEDKKEVFSDVLDSYYLKFNTIIEDKIKQLLANPLDKKNMLYEAIKTILNAHSIFTGFHNELIVMYYSDPVMFEKNQKQHRESLELTIMCLRQLANPDKVKNIEIAGTIVYSSIDAVIDRIVFLGEHDKEEEYITELTEMVSSYLF
ncbi:MAG: TetR/AcrR family transcriptional regulator [Clostridiaceae bacterium]